jgi:hypothetical protein
LVGCGFLGFGFWGLGFGVSGLGVRVRVRVAGRGRARARVRVERGASVDSAATRDGEDGRLELAAPEACHHLRGGAATGGRRREVAGLVLR